MKKNIFIILLISVSISAAYAVENASSHDLSFPLFSGTYFFPLNFSQEMDQEMDQETNDNIFSGNPNYYITGYDKFSGFGKFMLGFGNIFLGLGSLIAGEWRDMLRLDLNYILGAGSLVGGFFIIEAFKQMPFTMVVPILGTVVDIVGIAMGVILIPVGVYVYIRTIIDGFLYPYGIGSSPSSNKSIKENPLLNLSFNILPASNGKAAGQLSYTIRY